MNEKMNFDEFCEYLKAAVRDRLPYHLADTELTIMTCNKPSGSYIGLRCQHPGETIAPVFPLGSMYNDYTNGAEPESMVRTVVDTLRNLPAMTEFGGFDFSEMHNYEAIKDRLYVRAIPARSLSDEYVYETVGDIAFVYYISLSAPDSPRGHATTPVKAELFNKYGITMDQLREDAFKSMAAITPPRIETMPNMLAAMGVKDVGLSDGPVMIVVTGENMASGAAHIFNPDVQRQIEEKVGKDFFVLPSSVHEVICIPSGGHDYRELETMIRGINATEVSEEDFLSDHAYQFNSQTKCLVTAEAFSLGTQERQSLAADAALPAAEEGKITVLLVEPTKHPQVIQIRDELEDLQKAVGGYIEAVYPYEDAVGLIVNEEGKIDGLPLNRALYNEDGVVMDIVAGAFLVVGLSDEGFASLTPEQLEIYEQQFHQPEMFIKAGEDIIATKIPEETVGLFDDIPDEMFEEEEPEQRPVFPSM